MWRRVSFALFLRQFRSRLQPPVPAFLERHLILRFTFAHAPLDLVWVVPSSRCLVEEHIIAGFVLIDKSITFIHVKPFNGSWHARLFYISGRYKSSFQVRSPVSECLVSFLDLFNLDRLLSRRLVTP